MEGKVPHDALSYGSISMATETKTSRFHSEPVDPYEYPFDKQMHPDAISPELKPSWGRLLEMGCCLADAKYTDSMRNQGDTLVFLIPSREMQGDSMRELLAFFGEAKADELWIRRATGRVGYGTIVRMWWD